MLLSSGRGEAVDGTSRWAARDRATIPAARWGRDRISVMIAAFLFFCGCYFAKSVLPLHIRALGAGDVAVGGTIALINAVGLASRWVTGALQDRYGSKPFILGSAVCLAGVTVSYRFIADPSLLLLAAVFHGIALGSFATAASAQILVGADSEGARTSALSLYSMAHLTAMAVAPGLALTLAARMPTAAVLGWGTLGGAAAILAGLRVRSSARQAEGHAEGGVFAAARAAMSSVARDRVFLGSSALYLMWAVCYGAVYAFLPLFGRERGIPNVGAFFTAFATVNLVGRLFVGGLARSLGSRRLVHVSAALVAASMCLVATVRSPLYLAVAGAAYGLGSFSIYPCLAATAIGRASAGLGMAIALFMANFEIGQMVGSIALGSITSRVGYPAIYIIAAIGVCAGLAAYNLLTRPSTTRNRSAA